MTARILKIIAVSAALPLILLSCKGKEEKAEPLKPLQAAKAAEAAKPAEAVEAAKAEEALPVARRNPFMSYIILMKGREEAKKIKGPLECCELNLFKLIAVAASADSAFGLVQTPDNKRYVVHVGDMIGAREGKIVRIESRNITVRELTRDEEGKIISSMDIDISIPEKEAEQKR